MSKKIARKAPKLQRPISHPDKLPAEDSFIVWTFRNVDREGKFAFNPLSKDFSAADFVDKMLAYSTIKTKRFEDKVDKLFSFALNNKTRVIGFLDGAEFQVTWYDANHEFCPSTKKHT